MPADYRIIRTPNGHTLRARIVDQNAFGLGTQLDRFFMERKTEPSHYTPMAKPSNRVIRRDGNRQVSRRAADLSVVT